MRAAPARAVAWAPRRGVACHTCQHWHGMGRWRGFGWEILLLPRCLLWDRWAVCWIYVFFSGVWDSVERHPVLLDQ